MPTYDYECKVCKKTYELYQSIKVDVEKVCRLCGGEVERLLGCGIGILVKNREAFQTSDITGEPVVVTNVRQEKDLMKRHGMVRYDVNSKAKNRKGVTETKPKKFKWDRGK